MEELKLYLNGIVCVTCLTSDRELQQINDIEQIHDLLPDIQLNITEDKICWECHTALMNFIKFRQKASKAQHMFNEFVEGKLTSMKSFSNLKWELMVDGVKIFMEDQSSRIEIQTEENEQNIKQHNETEDNFINNNYYEEIKHPSCQDDNDTMFGYRSRENSQTDLSYNQKNEDYDDVDMLLQKLPPNFNIDDRDTYKIIENTLEMFLQDLPVLEKKSKVNKVEVNESDHDVNENENSFIELQTKNMDVLRSRAMNRYKNVSRKKITKDEMEEMLDRERENNCYKNAYFKCEKCVYGYDNVNQYTDHLVKHDEKQGPEECSICEQRFPERKLAVDHYLHHFMAFYCTVCGYTSRFLRFLKAHQENNECKAKSYPVWFYCDECDEKFALESLLTHHKKTLHEVKYVCKYCNKTFAKDYNRKMHEQIHKGRESVQCDICKKFFANKNSFQFHLKNVHDFTPKKSVYCKVCNKYYQRKHAYHVHEKSHKKEEEDS